MNKIQFFTVKKKNAMMSCNRKTVYNFHFSHYYLGLYSRIQDDRVWGIEERWVNYRVNYGVNEHWCVEAVQRSVFSHCCFNTQSRWVFTSFSVLLQSHPAFLSLSLSARVTRIWTRWALNRCSWVSGKRKETLYWHELLSSVSRHSFLHVGPVDSCLCGSFITNSALKVCQMLLNITHSLRLNTNTHTYKQRERVAVLKFITLGALIFSLCIWMHAQSMLHQRAKCTPTVIPRSRASAESRVNAPIDTPVTFIRPIGTRVSEARGR